MTVCTLVNPSNVDLMYVNETPAHGSQEKVDSFSKIPDVNSTPDSEILFRDHCKYFFEKIDERCAQDNWDSYGSKAVSEVAIARAKAFLKSFMSDQKRLLPHIAVFHDGSIMLTWRFKKNTLTVVVPESKRMFFSARIDDNEIDISFPTTKFEVPEELTRELKKFK